MELVITEWALDDYASLLHSAFSEEDYWTRLRPDILRLHHRATDPWFRSKLNWGPAQVGKGATVTDGFKMKWHNVGAGGIQLRLMVAMVSGDAWLCHAYSKTSERQDYRMGLKLEDRIQAIRDGDVERKGVLRER